MSVLPEDDDVLDQVAAVDVTDPLSADLGATENDDVEPDEVDQSAVPDLLPEDTEMEALHSRILGEERDEPVPVRQPTQHQLEMPDIRRTPVNEFNRSQALLSMAFPTLFPRGQAEFVEPRLRPIKYADYIQHALRWHDGRFARHPTFRFVVFNTLMRAQARAKSSYFVKQHHQRRGPITRDDLLEAFQNPESADAQQLLNSINRQTAQLRGTRPYWYRKRRELESYAYNLDSPGAFITFTPADLHWRSLYQHLPQFQDWQELPEQQRMGMSSKLLRDNPHIAAWHFYRRFGLFRDIVLKQKFNVTDYWNRYEWQGRGSSHCHGLFWMDGAPSVDLENEHTRKEFVRIWGSHVTALNPEPARVQQQGEGNPLAVNPLRHPLTFQWLSQILNRCQRHHCSETYCLRKKKDLGEISCRFFFPRGTRDTADVVRRQGQSYFSFEATRNDSLMNHYNRCLSLGWLANIDISPCTSLQAVINYAAKYCSKMEKRTDSYASLGRQILPYVSHHNPLLSFASRLMNKLLAERDFSGQEICHVLLNCELQEGTRVVRAVDCRPYEQQGRSLRLQGDHDDAEVVGIYDKLRWKYTEDDMAEAILDVTDNGFSPPQAAHRRGVPRRTLIDRLHGRGAVKEQIHPHRRLSKRQEDRLAFWILRQESLGYAPSHSQIRACVMGLLRQQGEHLDLGRNWVNKFINRRADLKTKMGRRQEAKRFDSFTPKAVHWYFDIRDGQYGWIKPENTVNVDEGGLDSLVVGSADPKRKAFLKGPQTRNWTSFIEAITADGRALVPGIIFKGKELQKQWFLEEFKQIADWYYITSPNGWTDDHIGIEWLERVYLPQTTPADDSDARLIILDGHGSHATDEWMATCFLNNVYCCYLPAHCSHGLQPLDNGVFNASKAAYRRELEKFASLTDSAPIDKVNFIRAYAKARRVGMTKKNILSGWRVTGNWPISREKALRHPEIQQDRPNGSPRVTPEPRPYLGSDDTPQTSRQIRDLGLNKTPKTRRRYNVIAKGFEAHQQTVAAHTLRIASLEEELARLKRGKKRKAVPNPNRRFMTLGEILAANWNTSKRDGTKWTRWGRQAKPRVLYYFPRYSSNRQHDQYDDFCRVKLMLAHPHRDPNQLRKVNGVEYASYALAAEFCYGNHQHPDDYYGTPNTDERRPDPDQFEREFHEPDLVEED
ncbi:hypothetical protein FOMA001_g17302 [Fusarium oxysporum f. sp. matthiolae]|nr:hypothetical protein FOMA001_g17302 [Fusarium oxysporum f. sp. matthiolae]